MMKCNEAMVMKDAPNWCKAVKEEHDCMVKHGVFKEVPHDQAPEGAKILTSAWAMKKKANGVHSCSVECLQDLNKLMASICNEDDKAAPVVNDAADSHCTCPHVDGRWCAELLDAHGAFLHGEFDDGQEVHMDVPQGFERFYPVNVVLLLLKTLHGTKQAVMAFWHKLLEAFRKMDFKCSKADPCLYFSWMVFGLVLWTSWIDDCMVLGKPEAVKIAKEQLQDAFECDEVGELKEHIGAKIDQNWED